MTYRVAKAGELPQWHWIDGKREVVIFKQNGQLRASSSICPHMGARLVPDSSGCKIQCPWHGLTFQLQDGKASSPHPVYRHLAQFDVQEADGFFTLTESKG